MHGRAFLRLSTTAYLLLAALGCPAQSKTDDSAAAPAKEPSAGEPATPAPAEASSRELPDESSEGVDADTESTGPSAELEETGASPDGPGDPCLSNVKKKEQGGRITYELMCSGTCGGEKKCESRTSTDQHGATRQWCGCADTEAEQGCYMVIHTSPKGRQSVACPPKDCGGGDTCKLKETGTMSGGGMKLTTLTCACPD